jgi:hypothetical protein
MRSAGQRAIKRGGATTGGGGTPLWSVLFAGVPADASIEIPPGDTVILDVDTPIYDHVSIAGTLMVDQTKPTALRAKSIVVEGTGKYWVGDDASPFPRTQTHTCELWGLRINDPNLATPDQQNANTMSSNRGLLVMAGGELSWIAEKVPVAIFKLGATANVGASSITSRVPVTLKANDKLYLGTTKYWQEGMSDTVAVSNGTAGENTEWGRRMGWGAEVVTVGADVNNSTIIPISSSTSYSYQGGAPVTTTTLQHKHWGQLQYLVPPALEEAPGTLLSLTARSILSGDDFGSVNGNPVTGARVISALAAGSSTVVDNCATVGLLTHPIKFCGGLDADWNVHGYGAHMMVMGMASKSRMVGVERFRVGQAGFLGRYPEHHHMRSYVVSTGVKLGGVNPAWNYSEQCSTWKSSNRGISIHGTCNFELRRNVYANTDTHAIFLEDGSEEDNVIDGNFMAATDRIGYGKLAIKRGVYVPEHSEYKGHDVPSHIGYRGPAGIWFTNPKNYLRNNIVSGAYVGIWNSFAAQCFGLSALVNISPRRQPAIEHKDNEAHSCRFMCMMTASVVIDESGNTVITGGGFGELGYQGPYEYWQQPEANVIEGARLWKPGRAWYENRAFNVKYLKWRCSALRGVNINADPQEVGIFGVAGGTLESPFIVTHTLDDYYSAHRPQQMVTYHNDLHRKNGIFVPAPMDAGVDYQSFLNKAMQKGGLLALWDFYENPVENQFTLDTNNAILGAQPGFPGLMLPPAFMWATNFPGYAAALGNPTITTPDSRQKSGAFKLPADGSMFGMNGGWWVFDDPFHLYGTTGSVYADSIPGYPNLNGKLLPASYNFIGFWAIRANGVSISGQDTGVLADAKPVNYTRLQEDASTVVGTWNTGAGDNNYFPKRHAASLNGCIMKTTWSRADVPLPTQLALQVWGFTFAGANCTWALDWKGVNGALSGNATVGGISMMPRGGPAVSFIGNGKSSKALLLAATSNAYWVDTANNMIWLRLFGGPAHNYPQEPVPSYITHNPLEIYIN